MLSKKLIFIFLFIPLFMGCIGKTYQKQKSVFMVFKTPSFKYADLGFVYENSESLKVELYGSGEALVSLSIGGNLICMSLFECMTGTSFNQKNLSKFYPSSILNNIFRGKKIFNGLNNQKNRNGFTQKITKVNKYEIEYSVLNNQVLFRDTINNILIKIKEVNRWNL